MRKRVYLSGGIEGIPWGEATGWRQEIINKLCMSGNYWDCFDPTEHFSMDDKPLEIMRYDLYKLRTSDLVIVNFNNPKSLGTMSEIAIAYELNIPIVGIIDDLSRLHHWQIYMCQKIVSDLDSATDYIARHYGGF